MSHEPLRNIAPPSSTTKRVLEDLEKTMISEPPAPPGDGGVRKHRFRRSRAEDDQDHEPPDELWLISYADMMTLLFGLFVMLYSMTAHFGEVQESAAKRFSEVSHPTPAAPAAETVRPAVVAAPPVVAPPAPDAREIDRLRGELLTMRGKAESLSSELQAALRREQAAAKHEAPPVAAISAENAKLKDQLAVLTQANTSLTQTNAAVTQANAALLAKEKLVAPPASSITVIMKWSTEQHDLDLTVKDPEGKVYDFKHRTYAGHPGTFVLDSRHGPGAEVWQSERIIPGIYEVRSVFYNTYGNANPARFTFSLLTSRGILNIPEDELVFGRRPAQTLRFRAGLDGTITVLK